MAGVGHFEQFVSEEDQADGVAPLASLPAVEAAAKELASALVLAGVSTGEALLECAKDTLIRAWEDLQDDAGADEPLILHFTGHGLTSPRTGTLYLATAGGDSRTSQLDRTCVSTRTLLEEAENSAYDSGRPVLFLLDVCGAGQAVVQQQLTDLATRRRQDGERSVWVIGACASDKATYGARFTTATAEALRQLVDGDLDISPIQQYVPLSTLAQAINHRLAAADLACGHPGEDVVHTPLPGTAVETPAFFPNPAHSNNPQAALLGGVNPLLREFALTCSPGLDPLHFATRAAGEPHFTDVLFSGRTSHLRRIQQWTENTGPEPGNRLLVVTGGPGSGKSALLGVTTCLLHPELDPLTDRVARAVDTFAPRRPKHVLAVHARQLTLQAVTDSLRRQLHEQQQDGHRTDSPTTADLVRALNTADDTLVILDALDETADPAEVLNELLLPLTTHDGGCRVLVGTRPWWDTLPALHRHLTMHPEAVLDTDPATPDDRRTLADDLDTYLRKLLPRHDRHRLRHIADRLADYSDHGAFLVAALYADHLRITPDEATFDPPCTVTEVFGVHTRQLAAKNPWIRPLLHVLGHARGQGMPLDLLHATALAHQPPAPGRPAPQLADTRHALTKIAFYLRTTPDTDHRLLYRYFHQALADHTRPHADPATLHHALLGTIPTTPAGTPQWQHAHPYLLRHAADHARTAADSSLDRLLEDPAYLLHADPDTLIPHLHHARNQQARLHAHIYRTTTAYDSRRHEIEVRRNLLALDATSWQQPDLTHTITHLQPLGTTVPPTPAWATRLTHPARLHTLTGHTDWVTEAATVEGPDGPLAITGGSDRTVIVWNPATGTRLHALTDHTDSITAVATVEGPDGPLAITTSRDHTAIVWNPVTGSRLHTLTDHTGWVTAVATVEGPDGPLAITGGSDGTAIVWNPVTGARLHALTDHTDSITAVATVEGPDGPLAIAGGGDGTVIVWNPVTGARLHTLTGHTDWVTAVATVEGPDGLLAIAGGGDGTVIVWNPVTGARLHTLTGHTKLITAVATVEGPDGPLAITTSRDHTVIVWNPATGTRLHTLTDHTEWVEAVATVEGPDGPLAITTGHDRTVIVWNPVTGARLRTLTGHTRWVSAIATVEGPDGPLAVTAGRNGTVIVWNPAVGDRFHTLTGHTGWVTAVAMVEGLDGPLAITTGGDGTVIVWNPAVGDRFHTLTGHTGWVTAVATVEGLDGPLAITTGHDRTVIVWNPATGTRLHTLTGHTGWVTAVATVEGPDGPLAITTCDRTAIVWNPATGTRLHTLTDHTDSITAVATVGSSDGLLAIAGGGDGTVIVWNPVTGARLHALTGHTDSITAVVTVEGPDGPLAITTSRDRTAIVWNPATGTRLHTLTGHTDSITAVVTVEGPDGPLAITTSRDRTAIVWNPATGTRLHTLTDHTGWVTAVATAEGPDGPLAVTADSDGTAIVWNPATGQLVHRCYLPLPVRAVAVHGPRLMVVYGHEVACIELPRTTTPFR
ncbi:WD40 repeat protein [Streptomyces sp. Ag109_G2-6]|nr:WD40 repeat protein [Streptomyces sp. Ag109_G2-6]